MGRLRGNIMPFLAGVVMGGVIISTVTLLFWSVSPPLYDAPIAAGSRTPMSANRLEVRQDAEMVGGGFPSEGCGCSQPENRVKTVKGRATALPAADWKQDVLRAMAKGRDLRDSLVVGVFRTGSQLEWAESVSETWGQEVSQLVFYRGEDSNVTSLQARALGLQLVEFPPHFPSSTSSSSASLLAVRLSILHHMTRHFVDSHLWFLIVTGDTYVHTKRLGRVLDRMNPHAPLILGPSSDCLSGGEAGGAVLVSQGLMKVLLPRLQSCVTPDVTSLGYSDVKMEACLGGVVKAHCLPLSELSGSFMEATEALSSELLKRKGAMLSSLLTYSPLNTQEEMPMLHHHYKRAELEASLARTRAMEQEVKEVCSAQGGTFFSPSSDKDCTLSLCSCQAPSVAKCPPSGVVLNIPPEFEPRTVYDYYPWEYFDTKTVYPELSVQPSFKLKMKRNLKVELQQALSRAIQKSSQSYGKPLKFKRLANGWVRHNPFVGSEYIIDYLLMDDNKKWLSQRVNLVRPLAKNYISVLEKFDTRTIVHFIVPLSSVTDRFKEFMSMYEVLVLATEQNAALILCVYGENDVREVKQIIGKYREKYPDMRVTVLEGQHAFSRSRALDLGFSSLATHDLAFVCDVDMTITRTFLDRCRSNTVEGKRVYYPEFFKLYNMDYVYWNKTKPYQIRLLREHGHWAYYSFGMLCIYKSDYMKVGGFDTNIVGWGGEDVTFFQKIVRNRISIMRAPDVALSHRWHPKECDKTLSPRQFKQCQSSREENLADRRELARYVYEEGPLETSGPSHAQTTPTQSTTTPTPSLPRTRETNSHGDADYNI